MTGRTRERREPIRRRPDRRGHEVDCDCVEPRDGQECGCVARTTWYGERPTRWICAACSGGTHAYRLNPQRDAQANEQPTAGGMMTNDPEATAAEAADVAEAARVRRAQEESAESVRETQRLRRERAQREAAEREAREAEGTP